MASPEHCNKGFKSYICNPRCCSFSSALDDRLSVHIVCGFWNGFIRYLGLLGSILRIGLYFLWSITVLRGYGDIAGENKAVVIGRAAQLSVSAILLLLGYGLVGAAIGYLANAILLRLSAVVMLRKHKEIEKGRHSDTMPVEASSIREIFLTIFHVAWRDGLVQLAVYASTQAMSILSSIFLGLAETGTYSILLQFANAIYNFASTYPKSFFPAMQSAFAGGDMERQREYVSTGIVGYWGLFAIWCLHFRSSPATPL